jgi:hypothetical protein
MSCHFFRELAPIYCKHIDRGIGVALEHRFDDRGVLAPTLLGGGQWRAIAESSMKYRFFRLQQLTPFGTPGTSQVTCAAMSDVLNFAEPPIPRAGETHEQ